MLMYSRIFIGLVSALILSAAGSVGAVDLNPGDILTLERIFSGTPDPDDAVLLRVDPVTGASEIISDPNHGVGPDLLMGAGAVSDVAIEASGQILVSSIILLVVDPFFEPVILRVDPATGDRTVVAGNGVGTTFGNLQPTLEVVPSTVAVASALQDWGIPLLVGFVLGVLYLRGRRRDVLQH